MKSTGLLISVAQTEQRAFNTIAAILIAFFIARMVTFSTLHLALFYDEAYYHF